MQSTSIFGQYAPQVAILATFALIAAWLISLVGNNTNAANALLPFATLAVGSIFGSASAANGFKSQLAAIHKRLDDANVPPANNPPTP